MEEKIYRKSRITKAQFDMIKITGRISGEVKDILTSEDKSKILQSNVDGTVRGGSMELEL